MSAQAQPHAKPYLPGPLICFSATLSFLLLGCFFFFLATCDSFVDDFFYLEEMYFLVFVFTICFFLWGSSVLWSIVIKSTTAPKRAKRFVFACSFCILLLFLLLVFLIFAFSLKASVSLPLLTLCYLPLPLGIGLGRYLESSLQVKQYFGQPVKNTASWVPFSAGLLRVVCSTALGLVLIYTVFFFYDSRMQEISTLLILALQLVITVSTLRSISLGGGKKRLAFWLAFWVGMNISIHSLMFLMPKQSFLFYYLFDLSKLLTCILLLSWWVVVNDSRVEDWLTSENVSEPFWGQRFYFWVATRQESFAMPSPCVLFLLFFASHLPGYAWSIIGLFPAYIDVFSLPARITGLMPMSIFLFWCGFLFWQKSPRAVGMCLAFATIGLVLQLVSLFHLFFSRTSFDIYLLFKTADTQLADIFIHVIAWVYFFRLFRLEGSANWERFNKQSTFFPLPAVLFQIFCVWVVFLCGTQPVLKFFYAFFEEADSTSFLDLMFAGFPQFFSVNVANADYNELDIIAWVLCPIFCLWASKKHFATATTFLWGLWGWVFFALFALASRYYFMLFLFEQSSTFFLWLVVALLFIFSCAFSVVPDTRLWFTGKCGSYRDSG